MGHVDLDPLRVLTRADYSVTHNVRYTKTITCTDLDDQRSMPQYLFAARRDLAPLAATINKKLNEALTLESTMNSKPAGQASAVPVNAEVARLVSNVVDQAIANFVARVNTVDVTLEDLFLASAEIQKLPLETCNREARTRCLARIFNGQTYKVIAVNARLEAMARVVRSGKIRRWVRPYMVAKIVFLAAAKEPILFTNKEWSFESDSFVLFVLEHAAVDGHA